ncbi:hypothetical protein MCEORH2_01175 [Methylophilaceae bacterium]
MNLHNRTIFASLALCALAFAQSATADDQVKSDSTIKSTPQSAVIKPVNTTVPPGYGKATPSTKESKISDAPSANSKSKMCMMPNGQMAPCK